MAGEPIRIKLPAGKQELSALRAGDSVHSARSARRTEKSSGRFILWIKSARPENPGAGSR